MKNFARSLLSALFLLAIPAYLAHAGEVTFKVTDAAGHPVENAVVLSAAPGKSSVPGKFEMRQENLAFDPYLLVVPVGAEVTFPNLDRVRHHVYSFSKGNRFELKLYGKEEARSITFENAGIVAIGCNIHDEMVAYIRVVDSAAYGKTNAKGEVTLSLSTAGKVSVWHPDAMGREVSVEAPATAKTPVEVSLKMKPKAHAH